MAENKRLIWADALRGLLIVLVVLGHSLQFGAFENRLSRNIINSFHVAAFFFISGFVSYKSNYPVSLINKKIQQLLYPFLTWMLLGVLIHRGGYEELINAFKHPDGTYWFIWTLLFITTLFICIHNISFRIFLKLVGVNQGGCYKDLALLFTITVLIIVMVITEFRLFGFQFLALYFGFFVYGYWLRKFEINFKIELVIILGIVWFFLTLFWRKHEVPAPLANISFIPASLLTYSYRYITAFIGSLFFIGFAMKFMNKECLIIKFLCYLGKISLGIYIIHLFIGRYVSSTLENIFNSNVSILFVLCDFTTKLILSIILINIIQRIPIVRLLLLGKK